VTGMTVREDSPELLVTSNDGRIYLFDLASYKLCFKMKGFWISRMIRYAASFSQDSTVVICPSEDKNVCFWNTAVTIPTKEVALPSLSRSLEADKFKASTKEVACAVFVPKVYSGDCDTRLFVVGDNRGNLTVFENPLVQ